MRSFVKKLLFGSSEKVFTIMFGVARGLRMMIDPNHRTQRIIGLDEYELQQPFKEFSKNSSVYIDLGSSDGYYPLIYRKYNKSGKIYSFEVLPNLVLQQPENFILNNFSTENLEVISKFASDVDDTDSKKVDSVVNVNGKKVFIKIDIEGAEEKALKGMSQVLKTNKCRLIVETHSKALESSCISFLTSLGYTSKIIDPGWMHKILPEERTIEHNRWFVATN